MTRRKQLLGPAARPGLPHARQLELLAAANRLEFRVPESRRADLPDDLGHGDLIAGEAAGRGGYGRIEFAFSVVFWLVLLLRDSSDVIVARELSRHPRLIRPLVDQVLAYKALFSLILFSGAGPDRVADAAGTPTG